MGKIKASLAEVSTEFKLLAPGSYELEIKSVKEHPGEDGDPKAYSVLSKVVAPGTDQHDQTFSDYINLKNSEGEIMDFALANLKKYFEVIYGIDEVSGPQVHGKRSGGWTDDQFDTDLLVGKRWKGHIIIDSYTKKGETEPRRNNKIKAMEAA